MPQSFTSSAIDLSEDETLDALAGSGLQIIQPKKGVRFALDPLLLCSFLRLRPRETVIDLGTGSGVIPLLLSTKEPQTKLLGIEIEAAAAARAQRNVSLNRLDDRIEILHGDLRHCRGSLAAQSADVIVTNPPYRRPARGRIAPSPERAAARHELHGTLADFLDASRFLLKERGRFYAIYLPERLPELLAGMCSRQIEPKRLRCVHSRGEEEACLVMVEGYRNGGPGMIVDPPLLIYGNTGYSDEVRRLAEAGQ